MSVFTNEAAVRLKFQFNDTGHVSTELIDSAIGDAHNAIMERIDPAIALDPVPELLVLGESILAGTLTLRALASGAAVTRKQVSLGGQRLDTSNQSEVLLGLSRDIEESACAILEPFLTEGPTDALITVTEPVPVLGEAG